MSHLNPPKPVYQDPLAAIKMLLGKVTFCLGEGRCFILCSSLGILETHKF
jgi:hypothetical protein